MIITRNIIGDNVIMRTHNRVSALYIFHVAFVFDNRFGENYIIHVIHQTRETAFHRDIQTPRRELRIRRSAEYF